MWVFALILVGYALFIYGLIIGTTLLQGGDPFSFIKTRVYLLDCWGKVRLSRLYKDAKAYVYPFYKIGEVSLNEDGTTTGTSYIDRWSYKNDFGVENNG